MILLEYAVRLQKRFEVQAHIAIWDSRHEKHNGQTFDGLGIASEDEQRPC